MTKILAPQTTPVEDLGHLLRRVKWDLLRPRKEDESMADWLKLLLALAREAVKDLFPPSSNDLEQRKRLLTEEGLRKIELLDREIERAYLEHLLTVGTGLFSEKDYVNFDLRQASNSLPFPPEFHFLPQVVLDYRRRISQLNGVEGENIAPLSDDIKSELRDLEAMNLNRWLEEFQKCQSDPSFLDQKINTLPSFITQRNILRELKTREDLEQKRLDRLEKRGTGWTLEEELGMLEEQKDGKPEKLNRRIAEIQFQIEKRGRLRERKNQQNVRRNQQIEMEAGIEAEMEAHQEIRRYRQFSEVMRDVPLLESMYRRAFAELRRADLFLPDFTIPSFKEICEPLFGLTQPSHYTRPEGIDYKEVIKTLNTNPETLLSLMKMGLTGGAPDIVEYSESEIHFADCSQKSPWGRRNLNYYQSVAMAEKMGLKTEKGTGLMHPDFYKNVFQERISAYHPQDNPTGGFDYCGQPLEYTEWSWGWLETDQETLDTGHAMEGDRLNGVVHVRPRHAHNQIPYGGWRASLRVKRA